MKAQFPLSFSNSIEKRHSMKNIRHSLYALAVSVPLLIACVKPTSAQGPASKTSIPPEILSIFDGPRYKGAIWGLRVVDLETGELLINLEPNRKFLIGSVRKLFS